MKRIAYILFAAVLAFACSPEEIIHPSEKDAPATASAYNPTVTVDQETNQVTFSLGEKAVIPVWVFQDKDGEWSDYKARDGFKRIFTIAGDYTVRMYVMNAAGTTPDYVEKTFHIDNSIVNFDKYIRNIAGKDSRVWRIDNEVEAHQACGESIANPAGWWAAKPDEKKDFGLYDNRMTFTVGGDYTFDPGEAGTVYVNTGVTVSPYGAYQEASDYRVPVQAQTTPYEFSVEGNDLILKLQDGALFPYIPNNDYVKDSKFHVISIDNNAMELVWYTATGNGGGPIAWQFILTSKEGEVTFNGFNYNADSNLWKPADEDGGVAVSYYYAPGWAQIADPEMEKSGNKYAWTLPSATSDRWQAQIFIVPATPISLTAEKQYDFSCILSASNDVTVKVKVHRFDENGSDADNGVVLVDADVPLKGGEDQVFYVSGAAGIDAGNIRIVVDWGGNPDNTDVSIARIVLKDHAIDDGTVLPDVNPDEPASGPKEYDYNGAANLWKPADAEGGLQLGYYYAPGWSQIADPEVQKSGSKYTWTLPSATSDRWQAQIFMVPVNPISLTSEKQYDFSCVLSATEDVTPKVKIHRFDENGSDADNGVILLDQDVPLKAGEDVILEASALAGIDAGNIRIVLDWGGNPDNCEVSIKNITLKDHAIDDGTHQGGGDEPGGGLVEGENLWADAVITMAYWYSASDWSGQLQPAEAELLPGNGLRVVMPEGIGGSEWMGQNSFHAAALPASKDEVYDFWMTLEADDDATVTVKLAWEGHDNTNAFFYDNNVKLEAGKALKYVRASIVTDEGADERNDYDGIVLFVDTGRVPAGTEVKMTDIHFQKHIGGTPDEPDKPEEDFTTNDPSIPNSLYDVEGAGNLWRGATVTNTYWYSGADWSGGLEPIVFPADDFGGIKVIVPEGIGGNEWQGQTIFHTDIPVAGGTPYDFCMTVISDEDINGMTVKMAWEGNDNDHAMFYVNDAKIKAHVPYTFKMKEVVPDVDYDKVVLFIDLGRAKVGTAVSFTNFCLQKNGSAASFGPNLWGEPALETWFSPSDWSGGLDPGAKYADGKLTLTVPEGVGGAEWQGQVKLTVPVAVAAAKKYDFSCKVLADDDVTVTVKLADAEHDAENAFFYDNNVALTASTPLVYKQSPVSPNVDYNATMLIFDFGRCPAGTEITVSDITLREIQ